MIGVHHPAVSSHLRRVTIVDRRSGPGYRIVMNLLTARGTPISDTLPDRFASVDAARAFATGELGLEIDRIKVDVKRR